ncbi:spore cortex biosynthesis protein YabQ [Pelotomaculum propionicicum]|uniref:spore cortex biosynthesis protein YabQ n=1 Tax=Pelotomaculum propionicicum TaxID=258475 RepID=UPI003B79710E
MEPLLSQARAFFMTIGIGILAAFCYDYYREIRRAFRFKKIGTFLGDLIYWLITTVIVFLLLLEANWGEMRMYVFLGLGLGALLYYYLLSKSASRLVRIKFYIIHRVCSLIVKIISFIWNAVLSPFRLFILLITYPLRFIRLHCKKTGRRLKTGFRNFAGGIIKSSTGAVRPAMARLAFWKKKKE